MSDMKCPFCGEKLENEMALFGGFESETGRLACSSQKCEWCQQCLEPEVWQALIDGKKAQDALKVAISALELVGNGKADEQGICRFVDERNCESVRTICRNALTEITSITKQEE